MANSPALRRAYELVNEGDLDGFFAYLAEDFVEHEAGPGLPPTKAGTKQLFAMMKAGFPDLRFDAEDVLESGDKVVARARVTGTNKGDFMGSPPVGGASTSRPSTSSALAPTVWCTSIGGSWTSCR
jgi:SnoaL-like polyketide cyclase